MQRIVPMKDSAAFIFVVDVYDTLITLIYLFLFYFFNLLAHYSLFFSLQLDSFDFFWS